MMKRYFIVFFICSSRNGQITGNVPKETDGAYLKNAALQKEITEDLGEYEVWDVIITNIIELSEQDYIDWIK